MNACQSKRTERSRVRGGIAILASFLICAAAPARAQTAGFWKVYLNGNQISALTTLGSDVWAATGAGSPGGGGAVRLASDGTFTQWNRATQGLLSDSCTAVATDLSGRVWFGTQGAGISILDPQSGRWTSFTSLTEQIPSDQIQRIRFAGNALAETLLVGTTQGYAMFVNGNSRDVCRSGLDVCGHLNPDVRDLLYYGDSLWIATAGGVTVRSQSRKTWNDHSTGLNGNALLTLAVVRDSLFAAGSNGVWVWQAPSLSWAQVGSAGLPSGFGLTDMIASGDTLWVAGTAHTASQGGVFQRTHGAWSRVGGALTSPTALAHSAAGRLIAGGADVFEEADGIMTLQGSQWTRRHITGPSVRDKYFSLAFDAGGALWLSSKIKTVPPMLSRYQDGQWSFLPGGQGGRSNQTIAKILPSGDNLYLAHCCCYEGVDALCGMEVTQPAPQDSTTFRVLTRYSDAIDLTTDGQGYLWVATQNSTTPRQKGLFRVSLTDTSSFVQATVETNAAHHSSLISDDLSAVRVTGRVVWIGYYQDGVSRWDFGSDDLPFTVDDQWTHFAGGVGDSTLLNNSVTCLEVAPDGKIWIGTNQGLSIYNGISFYSISAGVGSIPTAKVNSLIPTADGGAWVATENGGLTHMTPAQYGYTYDVYGPPDLPNPNIEAMTLAPDGKTLWLATDRGLASFYPPQPPLPAAAGKVAVYPNPFRMNCALDSEMRLLNVGGIASGVIIDLSGKVVGRFRNRAAGDPIWDARMGSVNGSGGGAKVVPGLYWIRASSPTGVHSIGVAVMDAACGM